MNEWDKLTPAEEKILRLLAAGMCNKEMAEELKISIKTVETQRSNLYHKVGTGMNTVLVLRKFYKFVELTEAK